MGTALALASAVCYGVADVTGGLLSRRVSPVAVALVGQAGGLLFALVLTPALPGDPYASDLAWGALSGVGTGIGMAYLYRGLARGAMSVVVPVSAVGGIALPVLAGVILLGDRPTLLASLGVAAAVPALWLVSRTDRRPGNAAGGPSGAAGGPSGNGAGGPSGSGAGGLSGNGAGGPSGNAAGDGLVAGAGIALQYLALAQAGPESGVWAVVAGRAAALVTVAPMALSAPERLRLAPRPLLGALGTGAVAALALVCYLAATRTELLTLAVVLASFYPVIPVLLGVLVLHERPTRGQLLGLAASAAAVALITLG